MTGLVVVIGALIVVGSTGIYGLRLQKALEKHAPGLATILPRDWSPALDFLIGAGMVARWF